MKASRLGILTVLLLGCYVSPTLSQQPKLYMPLDLEQAYLGPTRSFDGHPGPDYWQNHSDYQIKAELLPSLRLLKGSGKITYHNNSPDTLHTLVIRLYQNILKRGNARDWSVNNLDLHDGVEITRLLVDGRLYDLNDRTTPFYTQGTNVVLTLGRAILPQSSAEISIDWQFQISRYRNIRMGSYDSTSFFIAYWYPQIAVYDDVSGWDNYSYTGLQEFYNDFNSFQVDITVPASFVVWATGELQNGKQILNKKIHKYYQQARESNDIVNLIRADERQRSPLKDPSGPATWKFEAAKVPDFAFAAASGYLWDATSVVVDSMNGRRAMVHVGYRKQSPDFYDVAAIARETILSLSHDFPGVSYPYPSMTIFNGQGGMEFPMIVNDGSKVIRSDAVHLTSHEISHTYFPFMTGINERKYAWMDEGWAVFLPMNLQNRLAPGYDPLRKAIDTYETRAGKEMDIPMMVPSIIYGSNAYRPAYRNAAYGRPAVAYAMLQQLLGEQLFSQALQEYIRRWQGKHPLPYDFFFTFNDAAGEDLSWFWMPWFFDWGYPDLEIKDVFQAEDRMYAIIAQKGKLPIPVCLTAHYADGSQFIIKKNLRVWKQAREGISLQIPESVSVTKLILGNPYIPDVDTLNNVWTRPEDNH